MNENIMVIYRKGWKITNCRVGKNGKVFSLLFVNNFMIFPENHFKDFV